MNAKWIYSIDIKLSDKTTWESIRELCNSVINSINDLIPKLSKSKITEKEFYQNELEDIKHSFEIRLMDEEDFSMDENSSIEECNYLLDQFYDICDSRVKLNGEIRKFIWVNK